MERQTSIEILLFSSGNEAIDKKNFWEPLMKKKILELGGDIEEIKFLILMFIIHDKCSFESHFRVRDYIEKNSVALETYDIFLNVINRFYGYIAYEPKPIN